ncbi:ionotropic receptor 21a-like, partial [Portunus trituberculatus]|uniref:ionotropic receptor 21a-like n=1 Tax=Portunus trituberculatus TaxID=210409 RepID=UPI001E1CC9A2
RRTLQNSLVRTLQEVLQGPLEGLPVTLILQEDLNESYDANVLLRRIRKDVTVVMSLGGSEDTQDQEQDVEERRVGGSTGAVVAVVEGLVPWPLHRPPPLWSPSALLLMKVGGCEARRLLQTPLAQRTPALKSTKLINEGRTKDEELKKEQDQEEKEKETRVMTWLPYFPGGPRLLSLGAWSEQAFPTFHSLFPRRFESLGGAVVGVASDMDDAPLVFRDEEDKFDGTSKRLLDVIAKRMNFTYTLTDRAPDNKWGEMENGTWVGLLGEVYRGNKHLAINYFTITEERAQYFDYSVSYLTEGFGFALPIPPELPKWTKLVYPFAWDMWAAVGGATLTATAAFLLLSALQRHPHPTHPAPAGPAPSLAFIMKGLVSQAQARVPGAWSVRVFLGGWWLTAFVVDIAYTGCLIAVLTVPSYPARIHALSHLSLSHNRLCMLDYGEFVPDALLASEDRVMRTLGERMDLSPTTDVGFYGQEACAERVLAGVSAHVETYAYLKITYVDMGLGDRVYIMREQVYEGNLAFFFRKHTPWVAAVDRVMRAMIEAGFVEKWQADILEGLGMTGREDEAGSRPQPLGLAHLQGAFLLYGASLGVALMVFLTEHRKGGRSR